MNKTELAIMLARERAKGQLEALGSTALATEKGRGLTTGLELYDKMLQDALAQIDQSKKPVIASEARCWYCSSQGYHPNAFGDTYHPYKLCMYCGATATDNELHPYHKKLSLPYRKLAAQVSRLLGDARRVKLPLGYYQKRLPERCS